jgi:phage gp45-like
MLRGIIQSCSWVAGKVRRFTGTGLPGQNIRNREMVQHYGFASDPPAGCLNIIIERGNHIVSIAEDAPESRPDMNELSGAVATYVDATHYVMVKKDGSIIIKTDQPVSIESGNVLIGGAFALPTAGVVTGECLCAFTGAPHFDKSLKVKAVK